MKTNRGHVLLLTAILSFGYGASADESLVWNADTHTSVDVTINGVGSSPVSTLPFNAYSSLVSPSGSWQLDFSITGYFATIEDQGPYFVVSGTADLISLDAPLVPALIDHETLVHPDLFADAIRDWYRMPLLPFYEGSALNNGTLVRPLGTGWGGSILFTATTIPDSYDPSTWSWTIEVMASGPDVTAVPEPGTYLFFLFGSLIGLAAHPRSRREVSRN